MRLWHLITPLQVVEFFSSLFLEVNLNPKDQKNTTWPYRPYLWGPPFLAPWHPKHGRNCRYETLTLDNSTPSGLFFKQSVSGGKPEPKRPEKHNLATQTLTLGSAISLALPLKHLRYCHYETLEELLEGFWVAWYIMSPQFSCDVFDISSGKQAKIDFCTYLPDLPMLHFPPKMTRNKKHSYHVTYHATPNSLEQFLFWHLTTLLQVVQYSSSLVW